jgi:hypothetical protein
MLQAFTILIMLILGYAYLVEGLFTACLMCLNVIGAGLIAFNFWEPLANLMDPTLGGYEDALSLVFLFCVALGGLRTLTNLMVATEVDFPVAIQRGGGAFFGLLTGYLVSGFLVCVMQTLPFHQNFSYFDTKYVESFGGQQPSSSSNAPNASPSTAKYEPDTFRRFLPSDRVWLAMMHHAGAGPFSRGGPTFDEHGTFELRYLRLRRFDDDHQTMPNTGDFNADQYPTVPAPE